MIAFRNQSRVNRTAANLRDIEAASVIRDFDDDLAARLIGGNADRALRGLAGLEALLWRFEPVIRRISHHVRKWIADDVEHLPGKLGLGPVHLEFDVFPEFVAEIADDARQLGPGVADRLHAGLHDPFLQFGGDIREPLERPLEFAFRMPANDFEQLVAREHQFRNHGHQAFDGIDRYAQRLVAGRPRIGMAAFAGAAVGFAVFRFLVARSRCIAERPLEIVQGNLARTKLTLEYLRRKRADRHLAGGGGGSGAAV